MINWNSPTPLRVTPAVFRSIGRSIRLVFDRTELRIDESPLGCDVALFERLGEHAGRFESRDEFDEAGHRLFARAIVALPRARRAAAALLVASCLGGFRDVAKHVRPLHFDAGPGRRLQAWDQFFEIETAAQLHAGGRVDARFGEPDIQIRSGEAHYGVACKRVSDATSGARALATAMDQISRSGRLGVVAVNADQTTGMPLRARTLSDATGALELNVRRYGDEIRGATRPYWAPLPAFPTASGVALGAIIVATAFATHESSSTGQSVEQLVMRSFIVRNPLITGTGRRDVHRFFGEFDKSLRAGHSALVTIDIDELATKTDTELRSRLAEVRSRARGA